MEMATISVNPQASAPATPAGGMGGGQVVSAADFFAMLMQQMGGAMGQEGMAQQLIPGFGQTTEDDEAKKGCELAAQMMAALSLSPAMQPLGLPIDGALLETLAAGQQQAGAIPAQLIAMTQQQQPQQKGSATFSALSETANAPVVESALQGVIPGIKGEQTSAEAGTQNGSADNGLSFFQTISEAKKQMGDASQAKDSKSEIRLDLEQLQQDVEAGKYSAPLRVKNLSAKEMASSELLNQVKTGLTQGLKLGKNEFVVKLKPDGLGEITVKLVEVDNKISLSIIASNTQTAKVLGAGLGELQNSLRPYHAEVREVVDQQQYAAMENGQEQHQHFAGQQQSSKQRRETEDFFDRLTEPDDVQATPESSEQGIYI